MSFCMGSSQRNRRVAGLAQRHQIFVGVIAAARKRKNTVDFLSGNEMPSFKASLAERMLGDIQIPDLIPTASVALIEIRIALKTLLVIILVHFSSALVTISVSRQVIGHPGYR